MRARDPLQINEVLVQRYRIAAIAGQGGMSTVYEAEDLKLPGKRWAIKATRHYYRNKQAFTEEAEFLIRLNHPFLPQVVDFVPPNEEGFSFLVMDYIQGSTLQQLFDQNKSLAYTAIIKYAGQLCELFGYLHGFKPQPIIYRDLKPSNVMIDEQDNIRLIDFGIARKYREERIADTIQLGTVGFAAPEQYLNRQTDERTDLYTLGAMMYYLLSGGHHFSDTNKKLTEWATGFPRQLADVVHQLLENQPEHRIQTAAEVKRLLMDIGTEGSGAKRQAVITAQLGPMSRKLVVVGSLYPGAGSTFTALSLARVMNDLRIPHAVIEHQCNTPEMDSLLYGEKNKPADYRYYLERASGEKSLRQPVRWSDGVTEWLPMPPNYNADIDEMRWNADQYFRMLYELDHSIVIMDISSGWSEPGVMELCHAADHLLVVGGPFPSKWNSKQAEKNMKVIREHWGRRMTVHWAANLDESFSCGKEWIDAFPRPPICRVPAFPVKQILETQWQGRLIQDEDEVKEILKKVLLPLIEAIVPNLPGDRKKKERLFSPWFKRNKTVNVETY